MQMYNISRILPGDGKKMMQGYVTSLSLSHTFSLYLFKVYFEREREREQGRGRRREREKIPSRLCSVSAEPNMGLNPRNHEIMT